METAIQYVTHMNTFVTALLKISTSVEVHKGRRFDRIEVDGCIEYFVDKNTSQVYGAKSPLQYNPRRTFGTLATVEQFDWATNMPLAGTAIATEWHAHETAIQAGYKKRGRPRKVAIALTTEIA